MRTSLLAAGCLAATVASPVQSQRMLTTGDRIRLSYAPLGPSKAERIPDAVVATFVRLHGDSLYALVSPARDTGVFAIRALERIDISTGQYRPIAKGTWLGTLIGGVTGAAYGYLRAGGPQTLCTNACPKVPYSSRAQNAGRVGLMGASSGLVLGALFGRVATVDRWERANLALQVRSGP